jgi:hypothetical protein
MIDALNTHSDDLGSCSSPGCFRILFLLFSLLVVVMLDFHRFVVIGWFFRFGKLFRQNRGLHHFRLDCFERGCQSFLRLVCRN